MTPLAALSPDIPLVSLVGIGTSSDLRVYPLLAINPVSLPMQRADSPASADVGASSLSPLNLWERFADDWGLGSGQTYFDRSNIGDRAGDELSRSRYKTSAGVDPWTEGELSLLNNAALSRTGSSNNNLVAVVAGARLYFAKGSTLEYTTDGTAWTTVTGTAAFTIKTLATDGFTVYIGYGTSNVIQTTNTGISTASNFGATHQADKLAFVKGRLIGFIGNLVKNFTSTTAATDITPTFLVSPTMTWEAIGSGSNFIYYASSVGDKSLIYGSTVMPDGTELGIPRVMCDGIPEGENVKALGYYGSLVFIGTTKGFRVAFAGQGGLEPGPLVTTPNAVLCFEPQGSFMWHGMTNVDGTNTGLGRATMRDYVSPLKLAAAPDLRVSAQGAVRNVVTFLDKRWFTVDGTGNGLMAEDTAMKVASGTLETGNVSYGITARKFFRFAELAQSGLAAGGSIGLEASVDGGAFGASQTMTSVDGAAKNFSLTDAGGDTLVGRNVNLRLTLTRNTALTSPKLLAWTLRSLPIVRRGRAWQIVLDLRESFMGRDGQERRIDPETEYAFLTNLEDDGLPVTLQVGQTRYEAVIDSIGRPSGDGETPSVDYTETGNAWQGPLQIDLRVFS